MPEDRVDYVVLGDASDDLDLAAARTAHQRIDPVDPLDQPGPALLEDRGSRASARAAREGSPASVIRASLCSALAFRRLLCDTLEYHPSDRNRCRLGRRMCMIMRAKNAPG
jgi:hypothetical protein